MNEVIATGVYKVSREGGLRISADLLNTFSLLKLEFLLGC